METRPLAAVTGASSGIGLELANQFAEHGFDLVVAAEDDRISEVPAALAASGVDVRAVQVDLATREGVERLYAEIRGTGRPLDAIAVNAGVGVSGDFARDTDLEAELALIDLNVRSTVHLAKLVLRDMVARDQGRVLFTASVVSTAPAPFQAIYAASKAFVLSLSDALRNELKDTGVSVTALMPGPTETEFFERADMLDTKVGVSKKDDPEVVARRGFDGLMDGDAHVVGGGMKTRIQGWMNEVLPERVKAAALRRETEPGSAD